MSTITGVITELIRLPRSRSGMCGNPRFAVTIADAAGEKHNVLTAPNSGLAYCIENREFAERAHVFTIDGRGNIATAEAVEARA